MISPSYHQIKDLMNGCVFCICKSLYTSMCTWRWIDCCPNKTGRNSYQDGTRNHEEQGRWHLYRSKDGRPQPRSGQNEKGQRLWISIDPRIEGLNNEHQWISIDPRVEDLNNEHSVMQKEKGTMRSSIFLSRDQAATAAAFHQHSQRRPRPCTSAAPPRDATA